MEEPKLSALEVRVAALERLGAPEVPKDPELGKSAQRVRDACDALGIVSRFYRVSPDYYDLNLTDRAKMVHAPSIHHLCKSVLVKNTAWEGSRSSDRFSPANSEFYCVIVQYSHRIDDEKLPVAIRLLLPEERRLSKGKFVFRHATKEEADTLSGFQYNAIAPLGMTEARVPILVSEAVTRLEPTRMYLGAGEVDLKLQVNVKQFIEKASAVIAAISTPRTPEQILSLGQNGAPSLETLEAFSQIEIRVGRITEASKHPESEKLLVEKIIVGEDEPRQIVSGIQKFYAPEDIIGKKVAVVCNLKTSKLAGLASSGMILCASGPDGLSLIECPRSSIPGQLIGLKGEPMGTFASPAQMKKRRLLESISQAMKTDSELCAALSGTRWVVKELGETAFCTSKVHGNIS